MKNNTCQCGCEGWGSVAAGRPKGPVGGGYIRYIITLADEIVCCLGLIIGNRRLYCEFSDKA